MASPTVFVEREMSPVLFVVLEVVFQDATQPDFMKNYDVVQAFAPNGTDQPLDIGVLPRAAGRSKNFVKCPSIWPSQKTCANIFHRGHGADTLVHYPRGKLREVAARSIPQWDGK